MKVSVFPQCYAAVADRLGEYGRKSVIVDIGSWTLDLMVIKDKAPELSMCDTRPMGFITCMHEINKECVRQLNNEIDESDLEYIISMGKSDLGGEYNQIVESELKKFAQKVYNTLREFKINLDVTPITFVGGGASVMKLYGNIKRDKIHFVEDVKANAKGYEYLAKAYLLSKRNR